MFQRDIAHRDISSLLHPYLIAMMIKWNKRKYQTISKDLHTSENRWRIYVETIKTTRIKILVPPPKYLLLLSTFLNPEVHHPFQKLFIYEFFMQHVISRVWFIKQIPKIFHSNQYIYNDVADIAVFYYRYAL